jgi:hypothetical protein
MAAIYLGEVRWKYDAPFATKPTIHTYTKPHPGAPSGKSWYIRLNGKKAKAKKRNEEKKRRSGWDGARYANGPRLLAWPIGVFGLPGRVLLHPPMSRF